jgi:hypothetical protein
MIIDPTGMDWYTDVDGTKQYNPNLTKDNASEILTDGQSYAFANKKIGCDEYRKDGSIMYSKESAAYARITNRTKQTKNESFAVLTDNGTLVLPDYKNTHSENGASVNIEDYGYSFKNGNIVDAEGTVFNTIATAHTHPIGGGPSTWRIKDYGDLGVAAYQMPFKPLFVLEMDKKQNVSFIISGPDPKIGYSVQNTGVTIQGLTSGKYSLTKYSSLLIKAFKNAHEIEKAKSKK